ncbi:MAG: catalase HPII, partial [Gemmatimonadales bacterium]
MPRSKKPTQGKGDATASPRAKNTMGGPATPVTERETLLAEKMAATEDLSGAMKYNVNKAAEHGRDGALAPPEGTTATPATPVVTGST